MLVDLARVHDSLLESLSKRGHANLAHSIAVECRYEGAMKDPAVVYVVSLAVAGCKRIEAATFDAAILSAMEAFDRVRRAKHIQPRGVFLE